SPYYKIRFEPDTRRIHVNNIHHQAMEDLTKVGAFYQVPYLIADFRGRARNQPSYGCPGQRKANTSLRPPHQGPAIGSRSRAASRRIGLWLRRSKATRIRSSSICTAPPVSTNRR